MGNGAECSTLPGVGQTGQNLRQEKPGQGIFCLSYLCLFPLELLECLEKDFGKFQYTSDVSVREFFNILSHRALENSIDSGGNERIESREERERDEDGSFLWPAILPPFLVLLPALGGSGL